MVNSGETRERTSQPGRCVLRLWKSEDSVPQEDAARVLREGLVVSTASFFSSNFDLKTSKVL